MRQVCFLIAAFAVAFHAYAATTNVVDIAALAACGTGVTNGWTLSNIDSYTDKTSIRINDAAEYLVSPDFPCGIVEIIFMAKSSSQGGPVLAITPRLYGRFDPTNEILLAYSPNKDTYRLQSVAFTNLHRTAAFKIAYAAGSKGNTGWGISEMAVITDDVPVLSPPKNLRTTKVRATSASVRWDGCAIATSNRIEVFSVDSLPETCGVAADCDFGLCYYRNQYDQSADLHSHYPEFTAEKVYYPAATTGIVQISTTEANGRLTHSGFADYTGMALRISVARPGNDKSELLYAYYIDDLLQTNVFGTVAVSSVFTTGTIRLDGVPGGSAINLGNLDGVKSHRRYLIDEIAFLSDYLPARVETNLVSSVTAAGSSATIFGLNRRTDYLMSIEAFDSTGGRSGPSNPLLFTTRERDPGFTATLR